MKTQGLLWACLTDEGTVSTLVLDEQAGAGEISNGLAMELLNRLTLYIVAASQSIPKYDNRNINGP